MTHNRRSTTITPAGDGGYLHEGNWYVERTFSAKVSLVPGTRDETLGAEEKAQELFWDWLREQPSELDDAIDHQLSLYKEMREERMRG